MDKLVKENLFLLEFLVDQCIIEPKSLPKEIANDSGETCICFKFLDNEPLDVCEADFSPKRDYTAENSNMKSGKSCLFSLSPSQAKEVCNSFDIEVSVYKKLSTDAMPEKVQIGVAVVPVANLFKELIALLQSATQPETVSRTLKDTYNVRNSDYEVLGNVTVFIRMSCFGKLIVTQFQMNLEDKSVFFKDKEGKSLYKYRKATKAEGKLEATLEGRVPGESNTYGKNDDGSEDENLLYCTPDGKKPNMEGGKYNKPTGQFSKCNPEGYEECPAYKTVHDGDMGIKYDNRMTGRPQGYNNAEKKYSNTVNMTRSSYKNITENRFSAMNMQTSMYGMGGRKTDTDNGCYQEIGATMNGNGLKIRVLKDKGKVKRVDKEGDTAASSEDGYNRYSPLPGNQNPCCSYGTQPRGCTHADKQVLSLKPGDDSTNPFAFQVSGCDGPRNVTVVSPTSTRQDGTKVTEISDPNKDVFVLRIGKKSEGVDHKANLELELVTPKAIERKPPPKRETRETQYVESDIGPVADKKSISKKGKGKKGKGGKKGKKGKK